MYTYLLIKGNDCLGLNGLATGTYVKLDISTAVPGAEGSVDAQNRFVVLVFDRELGEADAPGLVDVANHGARRWAHSDRLQTAE